MKRNGVVSFVQFGTLSRAQWEKFAVCEVKKPAKASDLSKSGYTDTVYDERMGALENGRICLSCERDNRECPGHFGKITLEEPIYNPHYFPIVVSILKCICFNCGKCRLPDASLEILSKPAKKEKFLKAIVAACEVKKSKNSSTKKRYCQHCHNELFVVGVTQDGNRNIITREVNDKFVPMTTQDVLDVLLKIDEKTFKSLGFNSQLSPNPVFREENREEYGISHCHQITPDSFIFSIFPVIPPCCRPFVVRGKDQKHDDDITDRYNAVIKINNKLRDDREFGTKVVEEGKRKKLKLTEIERKKLIGDLEDNIRMIIDNKNEDNGSVAKAGVGISGRLNHKSGQFQSVVAGKRSDFTARTVIVGAGTMVRIGELGVPEEIAKTITAREFVTERNISYLQQLVNERKANYVFLGNVQINLRVATKDWTVPYPLKVSTPSAPIIVERHLRDGDYIIFNRQPTLRLESMQAMKVRILKGEFAFRLHVGGTRPYNADFDGD